MILILLNLLMTLLAIPSVIYFFQIKEYDFGRVQAALRDGSVIKYKLPAKSPRNFLIMVIIMSALTIYYYIVQDSYILILLGLPLAGLLVPTSVLITAPITAAKEWWLIHKAEKMIRNSDATFIGITGSYGKSSTKEYMATILSQKFRVEKTYKNYGAPVGLAISVINSLKPDTEYFVAEMGAYREGTITRSTNLAQPKYGVITALGNQHMELFGSKAKIIKAKSELFRGLPAGGIGYVNMDCDGYKKTTRDVKARLVTYSAENQSADLILEDWIMEIVKQKGITNPINLLPAIDIAVKLGMSREEITVGLMNIKQIVNNMSIYALDLGVKIINDTHNSNVDGFIEAIRLLQKQDSTHHYIFSRGVLELGIDKAPSYERILKELDESTTLVTTDKMFKQLGRENVEYVKGDKGLLEKFGLIADEYKGDMTILFEGRFAPEMMGEIQ